MRCLADQLWLLNAYDNNNNCQPSDCYMQPRDIISDHGLVVCQFVSTPFAACGTGDQTALPMEEAKSWSAHCVHMFMRAVWWRQQTMTYALWRDFRSLLQQAANNRWRLRFGIQCSCSWALSQGRGSTTSAVHHAVGRVCWSAATDEHCELTTVLRWFVKYAACILFMRRKKSNTELVESHSAVVAPGGSDNPCCLCCSVTWQKFCHKIIIQHHHWQAGAGLCRHGCCCAGRDQGHNSTCVHPTHYITLKIF